MNGIAWNEPNKQVLICGRNYQGQLGLGDPRNFPRNERDHPYQSVFVPIEHLEGKRVRQIACGGEHSVALTEDGEVHSFGAGNKGQLGHGNLRNEHFPTMVRRALFHSFTHSLTLTHSLARSLTRLRARQSKRNPFHFFLPFSRLWSSWSG